MIQPRPYQTECLDALAAGRERETAPQQLVVLPTGAGKTIVAGLDIKRLVEQSGRGAIFLAHRDELIVQPEEKIPYVWPGVDIGVVQGNSKRYEYGHQVTIASVQTVSRWGRLEELVQAQCYSVLYVDEAHHAPADTYRRVIDVLRAFNPEMIVVGLTATPVRADATAMSNAGFTEVSYTKSILDLMRDGYLADIRMLRVDLSVDLDGVPTVAGDLKQSKLRTLLCDPEVMVSMVDAWKANCGMRSLGFTVDVQHARELTATFRARGVAAEWVSGETPLEERRERIARFKDGGFEVLLNCQVTTEGYDDPELPSVCMFRPTKSQTLFIQMLGRGTRLTPDKGELLLLDFSYNTSRHALVQLPHLFGFDPIKTPSRRPAGKKVADDTVFEVPSVLSILREATEVDATKPPPRAGFHWVRTRYGYGLDIGREQGFLAVRPSRDDETRYEVWHHAPDEEGTRRYRRVLLTSEPMLFAWAFGLAEDAIRNFLSARNVDRFIGKDAEWRDSPASDKQLALCRRFGLLADQVDMFSDSHATTLTKGEAAELLSRHFIERELEPASAKQLNYLRNLGGKVTPDMTKREASAAIGRLRGGW